MQKRDKVLWSGKCVFGVESMVDNVGSGKWSLVYLFMYISIRVRYDRLKYREA